MEAQQNGHSGAQSKAVTTAAAAAAAASAASTRHQAEPELSSKTLTTYVIPLESCGAFLLLSVQTLDPKLASVIFLEFDLTALLLANSILGMSLFLVTNSHLRRFHVGKRVAFSLFGGFVLPFAAMHAWTQLSKLLPDATYVNGAIGIVTAAALLKLGHSYIGYVDLITSAHAVYFLV